MSSSKPSPKISPPPESFSELKQRIALIRELPFKREVSLANESPQATSEGILSDEYGTQSLVHISCAYKRLGLLPESADFAAAPADYVRLERTFYYEARKDLIVITPSKYYVKRENPLHIRPSGLARQMNESAVVDQTFGEWLVQLLQNDKVWQNLDSETESTVIPLDSAKGLTSVVF